MIMGLNSGKHQLINIDVNSVGVGSGYISGILSLDSYVILRGAIYTHSGNCTAGVEQSYDGSSWNISSTTNITAGGNFIIDHVVYEKYGRVSVTGITSISKLTFQVFGVVQT